MALNHIFLAISILLLSFLVIASNADYGYDPEPDTVKPETSYVPGPKPKPAYDIPNPDHDQPKPTTPKPNTANPGYEHGPKPNFEYDPKPHVDLPKLTIPKLPHHGHHYIPMPHHLPKPKLDHDKPGYEPESLLPICIEGLVVCKSGSDYVPIQGAVVKIACTTVEQHGYETTHFSCLTDAQGYYFKTLFPSGALGHDSKLKECKAYLESSPTETCKIPTDVNNGITGALLSSSHILSHKNIKLYSMKTFFYTSETTSTSTPAGGY
ncbi:unnamed protein product [Dovyalis caffra]|uniref:Uncharacterized protein n=1 Tax=Dovyalis caffra TaxID=77055 RepID=A0AAV1RSM7_9ROSI|nr:unnamed protein product [Dovyalis caffra]